MSDQDLTITGANVQVILTNDGSVVNVIPVIVSSQAEPVITKIEQRHLGTFRRNIDTEPDGWKGELEISRNTATVDDFIDDVLTSRIANAPKTLNLAITSRYRDGTSRTHVYQDIKLTAAPSTSKRGEASTVRFSWESGEQRIAA